MRVQWSRCEVKGPAISAICLPTRCPKFLGRRILGDENAAFLEDSVSRFLGHRISNVHPIFSLDVPARSYHHAMKCHRDKWPSSPPQSRLNSSTPRWLLPWGPGRAIAKNAGYPGDPATPRWAKGGWLHGPRRLPGDSPVIPHQESLRYTRIPTFGSVRVEPIHGSGVHVGDHDPRRMDPAPVGM